MKILVTGAAGFIGSHMCERLSSLGYQVTGLDNFSDYYNVELKKANAAALHKKNISVINEDLCSGDLSKILPSDIHYIFHFAGQPGISKDSTFESYQQNNFIATHNLLEYAQKLPDIKMFVNISTSSVYGLQATYAEDEEPKPASDYGVTKLAAEQLVLSRARLGILNSCSLRLFSVYGPRERPDKLFTRLIDCGINNKEFPLFEGSKNHLRSFTFVGDIIDGIQRVIGREEICNNQIFNIGTEAECSTAEGIQAVEEILDTTILFKNLPPRSGDQLKTNANISKARRLLGYNPKTTLLEGVSQQIEWFKNSILQLPEN